MNKNKFLLLAITIFLTGIIFGQRPKGFTQYVVNEIEIQNNKIFSDFEIKRKLEIKERGFLKKGIFSRRLMQLGRLSIQNLYLKHGYLECQVKDSFQILKNNQVNVYYKVRAGNQYYLSEIKFSGQKMFLKKEISDILNLETNQPYNRNKVENSIKNLKRTYANHGKPFLEIEDSISIDSTNGIHLFLDLIEHSKVSINEINIYNNNLTSKKLIRRELLIKSGDYYSKELIDKSRKYLFNTGYFSNISITNTNVDTTRGLLDLQVYVYERKPRYISMNFGVGEQQPISTTRRFTALSLEGEWLHRNLFQNGHKLRATASPSLNLDNFRTNLETDLSYKIPWLIGFRSQSLFRLFLEQIQFSKNEKLRIAGGEIALLINPNKRYYFKSGLETRMILSEYPDTLDSERIQKEEERAIKLNYKRDLRDDFLYPTEGYTYSLQGKVVGSILGGTQNYYKLEVAFSQYHNIFSELIFAYQLKGGLMRPFLQTKSTPEYEKFRLGGPNTLRGWQRERLITNKENNPVGRNIKMLGNFELRFPLFWRVGVELFFDTGGLFSDISSIKSQTIRSDAGFGLTFESPLGPVRLDFARILNPTAGEKDNPWGIRFGIPYAF